MLSWVLLVNSDSQTYCQILQSGYSHINNLTTVLLIFYETDIVPTNQHVLIYINLDRISTGTIFNGEQI